MPPKFTSRQLAFDAGPVPPFLQKLHAQVGQSRPQLGDKKAATRHNGGDNGGDEFDSLLGHQSHAGPSSPSRREVGSAPQDKTLRGTQGGASDDEDDWAGAQVVVLKEGKHLSVEEINEKQKARSEELYSDNDQYHRATLASATDKDESDTSAQRSANAGALPSSRRRRQINQEATTGHDTSASIDGLDDARTVIAAAKRRKNEQGDGHHVTDDSHEQRAKTKRLRREEKNKAARADKKKAGKGLSFDLDD